MSLAHRALGLAGTLVTAVAVDLALTSPAYAYIDPGTGTMLLQVVGAMIAAGLFYLRSARLWVSRRFGLGKANAESNGDNGDNGDSGKTE